MVVEVEDACRTTAPASPRCDVPIAVDIEGSEPCSGLPPPALIAAPNVQPPNGLHGVSSSVGRSAGWGPAEGVLCSDPPEHLARITRRTRTARIRRTVRVLRVAASPWSAGMATSNAVPATSTSALVADLVYLLADKGVTIVES